MKNNNHFEFNEGFVESLLRNIGLKVHFTWRKDKETKDMNLDSEIIFNSALPEIISSNDSRKKLL